MPYERAVRLLDAAEQLNRIRERLERLRPLEAAATRWDGDAYLIAAARNEIAEMLKEIQQ